MKPSKILLIGVFCFSLSGITGPYFVEAASQQANLFKRHHIPSGEVLAGDGLEGRGNLRQRVSTGQAPEREELKRSFTAEEAIHLAYLDTFYYRIDRWMPILKERIAWLKSSPQSVETQLDLMKYNYSLGGLNLELSHIMGFNKNYKIQKIENESLFYTRKAKEIANKILTREGLTPQQQAQAYLYLGAAEGSLGVLEFRAGNILAALINGFHADIHLEKALDLDRNMMDAHLGLGIYRYGNSRLGGLANLILQAGQDRRREGLVHIERAIRADGISTPLAIKTLAWLYIAVQINPDNATLPNDHPLSPYVGRLRVHELLARMETLYFKNPPAPFFVGNKEFTMIKAIQAVLDGEYVKARDDFEKILRINDFLQIFNGYEINPQQEVSLRSGIDFCNLMLLEFLQPERVESNHDICVKIHWQIVFMNNGGRVLEYEVEKMRDEINAVFYQRLVNLSKTHCRNQDFEIHESGYAFLN
ncbi:MAG: hypothetical protein ACE5ER_00445 [Nitrospinaceae bacterium]